MYNFLPMHDLKTMQHQKHVDQKSLRAGLAAGLAILVIALSFAANV